MARFLKGTKMNKQVQLNKLSQYYNTILNYNHEKNTDPLSNKIVRFVLFVNELKQSKAIALNGFEKAAIDAMINSIETRSSRYYDFVFYEKPSDGLIRIMTVDSDKGRAFSDSLEIDLYDTYIFAD